jgi:gliding motility-associated-like protein
MTMNNSFYHLIFIIFIITEVPIYANSIGEAETTKQEMVEICDNGKDDDGDGFIDFFDSDCPCRGPKNPADAFEDKIYIEQLSCDNTILIIPNAESHRVVWYKDSISLRDSGTNSNVLPVADFLDDQTIGRFYANIIFSDSSCQVVGPARISKKGITIIENITLCPDETYQFGDRLISTAGVYNQTFKNRNGCDSIVSLGVDFYNRTNFNLSAEIREGESYFFKNKPISEAGIYKDTLSNRNGCDSILTLTLKVLAAETEICDNNLDDDGDGLIDAFDEDCGCLNSRPIEELLPNGGFEKKEGCCSAIQSQEAVCVDNWVLLDGVPAIYRNPDCWAVQGQWLPVEGIHLESGFMIGQISYFREELHSTTIGTCLKEPMYAGNTYRLSIDLGRSFDSLVIQYEHPDVIGDMQFTINGIEDCSQLSSYKGAPGLCTSNRPYETLFSVNLLTLDSGWNELVVEVTPSTTIEAIFFSGDCEEILKEHQHFYTFYDNISIQRTGEFVENEEIKPSINLCQEIESLKIEVAADREIQWYKDSLPYQKTIGGLLSFSPEMQANSAGIYHAKITFEDGRCQLIGGFQHRVDPLFSEAIIDLCEGETYVWGKESINAAGNYFQIFQTKEGCDSSVTISVNLLETIIGDTLYIEKERGESQFFHGQSYTESGIYQATLSGKNGCDSLVFLHLEITNPCAIAISTQTEIGHPSCATKQDGFIEIFCSGGNPPYKYSIDGGQNYYDHSFFDSLSEGDFSITVQDEKACLTQGEVINLRTENRPSINIGKDSSLYEGMSMLLSIKEQNFEPTTYQWITEEMINCKDCKSIRISPKESAIYTLIVQDEHGCEAKDSIFIHLEKRPKIYIPNIFSPNADGHNDLFELKGSLSLLNRIESFQIFDRWGNQVFNQESTFLAQKKWQWNGFAQSGLVSDGVYIYLIELTNLKGDKQVLTGDFTVLK